MKFDELDKEALFVVPGYGRTMSMLYRKVREDRVQEIRFNRDGGVYLTLVNLLNLHPNPAVVQVIIPGLYFPE